MASLILGFLGIFNAYLGVGAGLPYDALLLPFLVIGGLTLLLLLRSPPPERIGYETVVINRSDYILPRGQQVLLIPASPDDDAGDFVNNLKYWLLEPRSLSSQLFFVAVSPYPEWWGVATRVLDVLSLVCPLTLVFFPASLKAPVYGQTAFISGLLGFNLPVMIYDFTLQWPLDTGIDELRGYLRNLIQSFGRLSQTTLRPSQAEVDFNLLFDRLRGKVIVPLTGISPASLRKPLNEYVEDIIRLSSPDMLGEPEVVILLASTSLYRTEISDFVKVPAAKAYGNLVPPERILVFPAALADAPFPCLILEVRGAHSLLGVQALEEDFRAVYPSRGVRVEVVRSE